MNETWMSPPEIDYLAKDYASFRQLMLDHLALRVPGWTERSEADLGIVLVEVLAYVADYLSYYQDAVATEAYLGTARRRPSIKRHARLLDYVLHEGCNARVWVQVQVSAPVILPQATQLLTHANISIPTLSIPPYSLAYDEALQGQTKVFETMYNIQLFPEHNEIHLYVEEGEEATLPQGCTGAILLNPMNEQHSGLRLKPGDVLVFEEVKNVTTGARTGIDTTRRHAVRLTGITRSRRAAGHVLHVTWADGDALPFPLRLAVRQQGDIISGITVARGNIVLADHGLTVRHEALPVVLPQQRYRPYLSQPNLAYAVPYSHEQALKQPASTVILQDVRSALPVLSLFQQSQSAPLKVDADCVSGLNALSISGSTRQQMIGEGVVLSPGTSIRAVHGVGWELHDTLRKRHWLAVPQGQSLDFTTFYQWTLRRDLLSSGPLDTDFTVDMEEDRRAYLRFGFGTQGKQPQPGNRFQVTYRVGGGEAGNVRADTITHIVTEETAITCVRNPLPALGGVEPESIEEVRDVAPYAFRAQQCCVAEEDYAAIAMQHPQVQNAVARLRWLGNRPVACIYVQRKQGQPVDEPFIAELRRFVDGYRLAGHALEIHGPYYVGLRIALRVRLQRYATSSVVGKALAQALSNQEGGFFFPDNFTFGQPIYSSQLIASVLAVAGVQQVEIEQFCRFDITPSTCAEDITPGTLEIVRLDNDATAPYNGILHIHLEDGL
ncbi:MAG TPA: baseplate J/gp47 family protein [Ktedonobacteraceae bacterium]|nr:baseplate J/gp47 family protein [Ktedonobacteraceae bacterium]